MAAPHKCKKGAPKWAMSFADMATLMLTFFILMLSFANMDIQNFRMMLGSVRDAFGVQTESHGQFQATMTAPDSEETDKDRGAGEGAGAGAKAAMDQETTMVADVAQSAVNSAGLQKAARVTKGKNGVRIRVKGKVLFDPGRTNLKKGIRTFVAGLAKALKKHKQLKLVVEGHTDNIPIRTARFPSNWELASARASSVIRELAEKHKISPDRLLAIGYADNNPLNRNETALERADNRRVEFIISRVARFSPEN